MVTWTKAFTRERPRLRLREMLTEAVRNTQPELKRPPKANKIPARPPPSIHHVFTKEL
jgi:hypothetical protein